MRGLPCETGCSVLSYITGVFPQGIQRRSFMNRYYAIQSFTTPSSPMRRNGPSIWKKFASIAMIKTH